LLAKALCGVNMIGRTQKPYIMQLTIIKREIISINIKRNWRKKFKELISNKY